MRICLKYICCLKGYPWRPACSSSQVNLMSQGLATAANVLPARVDPTLSFREYRTRRFSPAASADCPRPAYLFFLAAATTHRQAILMGKKRRARQPRLPSPLRKAYKSPGSVDCHNPIVWPVQYISVTTKPGGYLRLAASTARDHCAYISGSSDCRPASKAYGHEMPGSRDCPDRDAEEPRTCDCAMRGKPIKRGSCDCRETPIMQRPK